ncbi:hypothetical protein A5906_26500 [Bradyrhizobium sacchari]|uniref:Branched-chain amino acid transport system substrate-binding protein n=1 Tax=Bradyrhizobium sacchari TaxID=1399419 RepID=A0A560JYM6_9BRAD|nr:ABC transporter substrate-binding protein [Bradyrhizobium sacchari]OPY99274.1 hypothetical protein A5906_26500 [Bradyrhizobium sacchari]TWB62909.1 amino acid/amide ABC transporter substrate-binding protein (HAAT family) [Bradyrhizobium sacchari]TWB76161.1 branched-chain amino acid transport system substrate-binding protein [Bradyrhizobium sacchari]
MKLSRRTMLKGLALGGSQILGMPSIVKAQEPIRIGVLDIFSGAFSPFGPQLKLGISAFLGERNKALLGRPVELLLYDTQGQPSRAVEQTQRAVFDDKAHLLLGPVTSIEAFAVNSFLAAKQIQIPVFGTSVGGELTQRLINPSHLRITSTASQSTYPLADFAAKELRYRSIMIVADDNPLGWEISGGFQRVFEDAGGRITQRIWVPAVQSDYTDVLKQLGSHADAIFVALLGGRGVNFIQQTRRSGISSPLLANFSNMDAAVLERIPGGDELLGTISSTWYLPDFEIASNEIFASRMRADFGAPPGLNAAAAYTSGAVLEEGLRQVGGAIEDKFKFMEILRNSVVFDTIRGPIRFDERGNAIATIYIARATRGYRSDASVIGSAPIKKYPFVSQFWTYEPSSFLSSPPFSRDYPPARYLDRF